MLDKRQDATGRRPSGFTPQSGGLASEYARELGWGMNEDERTCSPQESHKYGEKNFDRSSHDIEEPAENTGHAQAEPVKTKLGRVEKAASIRGHRTRPGWPAA